MIRVPAKQFKNMRKQNGIVIVVVILIVTLMVTLLALMVENQHLLIRRVTNQNVAEQGFQYAEAVNAWAERVLNDDVNRDVDYLLEDWATFGQPLEDESEGNERDSFSLQSSLREDDEESERVVIDIGFDGLEYSIDDLQAKFNLNNLSSENPQFVLNQKRIFTNILELLEIGDFDQRERLFGALADWVDGNDEENIPGGGGTESGSYSVKSTPYFAADQKLTTLGELKFVEGFTAEIISQIGPYVTVLPVDNARININTAEAEVVASLSGAVIVDTGSVSAFLAERLQDGFQGFSRSDIQEAETAIIGTNPVGAPPIKDMMQVNSQFFQINAKITLGDYQYCMKTTVLREPISADGSSTPKISVLRREQDTLCKEESTRVETPDENQ